MRRILAMLSGLLLSGLAIAEVVATATPGTWGLHLSSTNAEIASGLPSLDACVSAAKARNVAQSYKCRTAQTVVVSIVVAPPPPPPPPVDCVVGEWGAWVGGEWSACGAGQQSRIESRSRLIVTQPANGGATCPNLVEFRPAVQPCEMPPPPSGAQLVFDDGFEGGIPASKYKVITNGSGVLEVSGAHAREGSQSLHTKIIKSGTSNYRQEVRALSPLDGDSLNGTPFYWFGVSIYVPASSNIGTQSVGLQWHTLDPNSGASPVIGLRMIDNRWQFTSDSMPDQLIGPAIVRDQWHDWVFKILWRNDSSGSIQIWCDGALLVDRVNVRTTWGGENAIPTPRFGSYSSSWKQSSNPDKQGSVHETFHDAIRFVMSNSATYEDVAPRGDRLAAH